MIKEKDLTKTSAIVAEVRIQKRGGEVEKFYFESEKEAIDFCDEVYGRNPSLKNLDDGKWEVENEGEKFYFNSEEEAVDFFDEIYSSHRPVMWCDDYRTQYWDAEKGIYVDRRDAEIVEGTLVVADDWGNFYENKEDIKYFIERVL